MTKLIEEAQAYEPKQTLNIADLEIVSVDVDIQEENDVEFPYKFITVDGKRYRVPTSVIAELKEHLAENPKLSKFRVKKTGDGMNTKYTVIPLV